MIGNTGLDMIGYFCYKTERKETAYGMNWYFDQLVLI